MTTILTFTTAGFMLHLFWASLGWGVILQFLWSHLVRWTGGTPAVIPVGGATHFNQVGWRMPQGMDWFTEIFFMVNSVGSIFMYISDPTYSAFHGIVWDQYAIAVIIILVVGISFELFPWLEQRTNPITANIGVNLALAILFSLLFQ